MARTGVTTVMGIRCKPRRSTALELALHCADGSVWHLTLTGAAQTLGHSLPNFCEILGQEIDLEAWLAEHGWAVRRRTDGRQADSTLVAH